ncbi:MAG: hypothetical protein WC599_07990 [Bacteroidales bacterium]
MNELIDIFIKLHIALITLLVPMLIFYINYASDAKRAKDDAYDKKIKELQKNAQLDNSGDTKKFANQVTDLHTKIALLNAQRVLDLKRLNPFRQMKRIYGMLLSSFILIILDVAVRNNIILPYNHYLSCILIALSIILLIITSVLIWNVAIVAIKSKEDIENILGK